MDYKKNTDEELVEYFKNGDKNALSELLVRYKNMVKSRARCFFLVGAETEDIIQEGMCGLYSAILTYEEGKSSFKSFAYGCVNKKIFTAIKSTTRQKHIPLNNYVSLFDENNEDSNVSDELSPEDVLINAESEKEIKNIIKQSLSKTEYKVIDLYLKGYSYEDISIKIGVSRKSVDNAIARSKKKLESILKSYKK